MSPDSLSAFDAEVYTQVEDAVTEVRKRYLDTELKKRVTEYIGLDTLSKIPYILHEPVGVSFRHVATPNFENSRFISFTQNASMRPVFFEYFDDKFTSNNPAKHMLGKCHVYCGTGKNGGEKIEHHTIIDFNASNGKLIRDVHTIDGKTLIDFHHKIFLRLYPEFAPSLFDASAVFADWGDSAQLYYKKFLALFICFGVLVETFTPEDAVERPFIDNVFLPAFTEVQAEFGLKPLIVRLLPAEDAADHFWYYYPEGNFLMPDTV